MGLMFRKKLDDMSKNEIWLVKWYMTYLPNCYELEYNHITEEYSLYSPYL